MAARNTQALHLYRHIMRLHKKLPDEFQILGNAYARDEFKRHATAKPEHVGPFMTGWREYADVLQEQIQTRARKLGKPLDEEDSAALSDEQVGQLYELHTESQKPRLQ